MKTTATKLTVRLFLSRLLQVPELVWNHLTISPQSVEQRQLRQFMGEDFLSWADEYFSDDARRNKRIPRKEIYNSFLEYAPDHIKYTPPSTFKYKIKKFCELKGYIFNTQKYGPEFWENPSRSNMIGMANVDDKSAGIEYFTVADPDRWIAGHPVQVKEYKQNNVINVLTECHG